ncbi:MAG TPA: DegQ family serine endoprotease [Xanthobacteraceae bacterium]|jgi:serine protease Do
MKEKLAFLGLTAAALIAGGYWAGAANISSAAAAPAVQVAQAQPAQTQAAPQAARPAAVQTLPDFTSIVESNKGAVVNITSTLKAKASSDDDDDAAQGMDEDDPFYQFFRHFQGQMPRQQPQIRQGMGSGFIVESNGTILTNAHVVEGADEVRVRLSDRREFKGKVLGLDHQSDIAVVKIDATGLPTVKLGDPSQTKVGEWVLAIGSPFGFENSATVGIVSATSRSLPDGTYVPFIQTDAAVNPGNSGGPLFNMKGEVIGINSQIYSRSGGYQGISFAIPINVAAQVKEQLVKYGKVERGRMGVAIQEVSQSLAQSFGLDKPRGALVAAVEPGGPADKAGIKPGDVLLSVNGKAVDRSAELPPLVAAVKPGTKANFDVWRDGSKRTIAVTVTELKPEQVASAKPTSRRGDDTGKLGLALRQDEDGLVVENASGPAARAGIQRGDIVVAVNGKRVKNLEELRTAAAKAKGSVALLVKRGDQSIFVPIEIG